MLLCHNLKAICEKGGFSLIKWISNSRVMLAAIPEKEKAKEVKDLDLDQDSLPMERAFGVQWCVESDQFKFRIVIQDKPPTRGNILSMVSSIYDPLGILAPVVLPAKKVLQELCRLKLSLDDIIPTHLVQQWFDWIKDLQFLSEFGVDRCFKLAHFGEPTFAELHHFCDASKEGYGTVTYLELKKAIQEWNTSKIEYTLLQLGIKWMFNPPAASHHGGVWEHLIRSIKKILNATLRTQSLDEESKHFFVKLRPSLTGDPLPHLPVTPVTWRHSAQITSYY